MLRDGVQMTFERGVSVRNLLARFVWFCLRRDLWWLQMKVETSESLKYSDVFVRLEGKLCLSLNALKMDCRT